MIVLGIETTCDETAAAVVERPEAGPGNILANVVLSQVNEHIAKTNKSHLTIIGWYIL